MVSVVIDQHITQTLRCSFPTGRARIVTNRVVRSTRVAAAEVPSVPDDQVTLPVPWDPTIIHILGAVINADHPHDRMGALPHQVDAACVWCASSAA